MHSLFNEMKDLEIQAVVKMVDHHEVQTFVPSMDHKDV